MPEGGRPLTENRPRARRRGAVEAREAVPEGWESAPRPRRRGLAPPEAPHGPPSGGPADGAPETGPKALVELRGQLVQAREHVQGRRGDRGVPQQRLELAERVRVPAQEERRQRAAEGVPAAPVPAEFRLAEEPPDPLADAPWTHRPPGQRARQDQVGGLGLLGGRPLPERRPCLRGEERDRPRAALALDAHSAPPQVEASQRTRVTSNRRSEKSSPISTRSRGVVNTLSRVIIYLTQTASWGSLGA